MWHPRVEGDEPDLHFVVTSDVKLSSDSSKNVIGVLSSAMDGNLENILLRERRLLSLFEGDSVLGTCLKSTISLSH